MQWRFGAGRWPKARVLSAEALDRRSEGAGGTARVLAELPTLGWRVFNDMRWPGRRYANIDHVVVGPTGVFVIDTLTWSGNIEVRDGILRQDGRRRDRSVLAAMDAAETLSELVPGVGPRAVHAVSLLRQGRTSLRMGR